MRMFSSAFGFTAVTYEPMDLTIKNSVWRDHKRVYTVRTEIVSTSTITNMAMIRNFQVTAPTQLAHTEHILWSVIHKIKLKIIVPIEMRDYKSTQQQSILPEF
jgi:hypothetical protein